MHKNYLNSVIRQFEYYRDLGLETINRLTDDQLSWQYNEESNTITTIIKHLSGNMLSRWTDFLHTDGEKESRRREQEFVADVRSKKELLEIWNKGWQCLFTTLNNLNEDDLQKVIYIRNQEHTVTEAINRQLAHYPYHIGQIVFIGKMIMNDQWNSLSIPKGESDQFNAAKFSQQRTRNSPTDNPPQNQINHI